MDKKFPEYDNEDMDEDGEPNVEWFPIPAKLLELGGEVSPENVAEERV